MAQPEPRITIPLRTRDQRGAERFDVAMPVRVEGGSGATRDLSASGLSFEADRPYSPGEHVTVVIEYLMDGHDFPLKCAAKVARCEKRGDKYVVGARLLVPLPDEDPESP